MQAMSCFGLCCPLATTGGEHGGMFHGPAVDKTSVDKTSVDKTPEPAGKKPQAAESTETTV